MSPFFSFSLDTLREWLTSVEIKYYESRLNLNWKPILKNILADPEDFIAQGGWKFLDMEGSDDDEDGGSEESEAYEPSDDGDDDDSDDDDDSGDSDESVVDSDEVRAACPPASGPAPDAHELLSAHV